MFTGSHFATLKFFAKLAQGTEKASDTLPVPYLAYFTTKYLRRKGGDKLSQLRR